MLTRDAAREIWRETGLQISDLTLGDLAALRRSLDKTMRGSGLIRGSFRIDGRARVRRESGRVVFAELRCRSCYFEGRQAVTFERGGFVCFAGWADDTNLQPVLEAFIRWARERAALPA